MIHLNGSGVPLGDSRYGSRRNACDHPESKIIWSGQWLPVGVGRPTIMKGKCACGQTVSQSHDDPHGKPPYDNPYWTGPDGVRKPLGNAGPLKPVVNPEGVCSWCVEKNLGRDCLLLEDGSGWIHADCLNKKMIAEMKPKGRTNDTNEGTVVKYKGYTIKSVPTYEAKGRQWIWHIYGPGEDPSGEAGDAENTCADAKRLIDIWVARDAKSVKNASPAFDRLKAHVMDTGHDPFRQGNDCEDCAAYRRWYARQARGNAAPVQAMTLLIRGDLQDLSIPVADVDDASRKYREYVEREDLGSSEVAFGKVVMGGKLVATIKYNGRIQLENAKQCRDCKAIVGDRWSYFSRDTKDGVTHCMVADLGQLPEPYCLSQKRKGATK